MIKKLLCAAGLCAILVGCAVPTNDSPDAVVAGAAYRPQGPTAITVFTMVNNRTGAGGHTALLVEGSQAVIFDPAGSYINPRVPEKGDVLYGMSPVWVQNYKSAHARSDFHVVSQKFLVSPSTAERALQLVQANGPVPSAFCASATTRLLQQVPGFADVRQGFYPVKLMEQLAQRPDVITTRYFEDDDGNVVDGIRALPQQVE
ncbi:hypothetical protein [Sulfitobacter sp. S190]|uniref:hypothetical protein n=1 Tax=Sulfitobacter sp. S190 TaxID=2867022 RepID=UPI0021A2670F|nr:hypothetical protein [Sulfitobacter sp. S190]UWR23086.1 hypothetical protein K3756_03560 [Sulfitobacter sp. S190]